jgi:NAD(P)-dependent dehydrogenase (short-subunit alcohol dehydrogenase family)
MRQTNAPSRELHIAKEVVRAKKKRLSEKSSEALQAGARKYSAIRSPEQHQAHSLATQVVPSGIRVNVVAPGSFSTPRDPLDGGKLRMKRPAQPEGSAPACVLLTLAQSRLAASVKPYPLRNTADYRRLLGMDENGSRRV